MSAKGIKGGAWELEGSADSAAAVLSPAAGLT